MRPWIDQPEIHNRWLDQTGLVIPGETRGSTSLGAGLHRQQAAGLAVFLPVLEPNRTVFLVETRTPGGLPWPVANTCLAIVADMLKTYKQLVAASTH